MIQRKIIVKKFFILLAGTFIFTLNLCPGSAETNLEYFFGPSDEYKDVLVREVISADTIKLESGERIKLIGLRAPTVPKSARQNIERDEYGFVIEKPIDPATPIEMRSYLFAKHLLEGKRVRLEFDSEKKNDNLDTLAYIFVGKKNIFANVEILRQGYAELQTSSLNTKYADALREAYKEARQEHRGLYEDQ